MLSVVTCLLLVSQVTAGFVGNAAQLIRKDDSLEHRMKRYIDSIVEPVERRQTTTTSMSGINVTAWNQQTADACTTTLEALNGVANNPSGMAVCYNLPYLDNTTGVFEADLRLYMISAPTGSFANISSANVQVGLAYNGATVSAVNASSLKKRSDAVSLISWPRGLDEFNKRTTAPTLVQAYAFVGQINSNVLNTSMGTAAIQKVIVPVVTLTGTDASGNKVNTSLSSDEATFVSGVFAAQVSTTKVQTSAPMQTLVVASGAPFVLPGQNILIVPIGLIITSVWTVLFIATIAYGTVGRMQFRDQFRRRNARAQKGDFARI